MEELHKHDEPTSDSDWSTNTAKATAMIVLFVASFLIGGLPIKLNKWFKWELDTKKNTFVKMLLGLGGGVLFCTTFIHLLPEVTENIENLDIDLGVEIPYAELLMCIGFFIIYFVEESVKAYLQRKQKLKGSNIARMSLSVTRLEVDFEKEISNSEESQDSQEGKSHNAGHSNVFIDESEISRFQKTIRGLLIVLALSVHALFEGLAVGLESSSGTVWYMFGAISAHKLVIAFCIGVELVTCGMKTSLILFYGFTFAIVSPLGIGLGMILSNTNQNSADIASVILQGIAAGTLLYVVFFEILQAENKSGLKQLLSVVVGFLIMFGISMFNV